MRSKSSIESEIFASLAIASKCSTAFVDPPVAATPVMAIFNRGFGDDFRGSDIAAKEIRTNSPAR